MVDTIIPYEYDENGKEVPNNLPKNTILQGSELQGSEIEASNLSDLQEGRQTEENQNIDKINYLKSKLGYDEYNDDGKPNFNKIPKEDAKKAAEAYGEGCGSLTKFLEICFEHGIRTTASCAGHPEEYKFESYVDFDISDERTKELVEFVVENKLADELRIRKIKHGSEEICVLSMGVVVGKRDSLYDACTKQIEKIIQKYDVGEDKTKEDITDNSDKSLIRRLIEIVENCNINDDVNINDSTDEGYTIDFKVQNGIIVTTPGMEKYMIENGFSQIK